MTANRDLANEIYEPSLRSRTVLSASIPETAPTLATHGYSCSGWNFLRVGVKLGGSSTTHAYVVHVYDGESWIELQNTADFSAAEFDVANDTTKLYVVTGATRYDVQFTGGDDDMVVSQNLSV